MHFLTRRFVKETGGRNVVSDHQMETNASCKLKHHLQGSEWGPVTLPVFKTGES
jgi:hypothetical protein